MSLAGGSRPAAPGGGLSAALARGSVGVNPGAKRSGLTPKEPCATRPIDRSSRSVDALPTDASGRPSTSGARRVHWADRYSWRAKRAPLRSPDSPSRFRGARTRRTVAGAHPHDRRGVQLAGFSGPAAHPWAARPTHRQGHPTGGALPLRSSAPESIPARGLCALSTAVHRESPWSNVRCSGGPDLGRWAVRFHSDPGCLPGALG